MLYCRLYSETINFAGGRRPCFKIPGQPQVLCAGFAVFHGVHQGCLTGGENEIPKAKAPELEMGEEGRPIPSLPQPGVPTPDSPARWEAGRETPVDHAGGCPVGAGGGGRPEGNLLSPFCGSPTEPAVV